VEQFKGATGATGEAMATVFYLCGGGGYYPGRTYLLFIEGSDRTISDINSKILSDDPTLREQQLQPLRDFEAGVGDGFGSPNELEAGTLDALDGTRCESAGIQGRSNFPYYPTLRNAYEKSDHVVRAQVLRQEIDKAGNVVVSVQVAETYKGDTHERATFLTSVFSSPEWMQSCLRILVGWQYLLYVNEPRHWIDARHSLALTLAPASMDIKDDLLIGDEKQRGLAMLRLMSNP